MAAGVVSGAVADLLQANPNLTPDQVKALLMQTAYKVFPSSSTVSDSTGTYTDYYDIFTVGAGYLDLGAAVASVHNVPAGSAMSPVATDQGNGVVTLAFTSPSAMQSIWGSQSIWASQSIWGSSIVGSNQCIWASQSIWASSSSTAEQSIWGSQSIWASGTATPANAATAQSVMIGEHD